jgi:hypothetical protein
MHRNDRPRLRRDQPLDRLRIDVERIRPNIRETRLRSPEHEGVDGRREGETRRDDLVFGTKVEGERRHFERMRAGRRQACVTDAQDGREHGVAGV